MNNLIKENKISDLRDKNLQHLAEIGKVSCNILHDLINPITGLILYLEQNMLDKKSIESAIKPISEISNSIRNFISSVNNDLLSGSVNKQEIELSEIINTSLNLFKPKLISKNISIQFLYIKSDYLIYGNKLNLYQIILNLISNAIDSFENIDPGKKRVISINLSKNKEYYFLQVRDNGSGIKKSNLDKIFKNNFTTKDQGFGIGLYHTKNLIEQEFHSKISVKSRLNFGSFFQIKFKRK